MSTRWLTFTAFLACSGVTHPERAAITIAPTCRVKGHLEAELTLNCGDGKKAGVVQYWHTPFGDLQTPGFYSKLDPVFMHRDGSLVVPSTSFLHSGLYYCLLQHTEGTTLWPYKLHVAPNTQKNQEHSKYEQHSSWDVFRFRRDVESELEGQADVSDGQFAGAVAASVLLTFVLGFSAGALTRTHVLRCLSAVTKRLRSSQKPQCQTDTSDHDSKVINTTLTMYDNQAFEMEEQTKISSTTSSPPAKPQRSFRNKQQEEQETTAYLEGCDYIKEEERRMEEATEKSLEQRNKGCDGETEEEEIYLAGEDGGSQTVTDEDECSKERGEREGRESREEKMEWRQKKEVEEAAEQENRRSKEGEERRGREKEAGGNSEQERDKKREEEEEGWREIKEQDDSETDICSEDDETGSETQDTMESGITGGGEPASSPPCPARRSRVIRLYQYDDEGQRYCHLPEPTPDEPAPAPRLKQRSVSLTRLSAIMAAASAGPLDTTETGREEREERPHFSMEI